MVIIKDVPELCLTRGQVFCTRNSKQYQSLIKSGSAELISSGKEPYTRRPPAIPQYICECGFVGKNKDDLENHIKNDCECGEKSSKKKLNLGCGKDIREGFINIDVRPLPGVDIVADVRNINIKADYILARDIIEHFPQAETLGILTHWVSLLNSGGIIEIQCPDVLWAYEVSQKRGANWLIQLLYGGQDYPENFHKAGFTLDSMRKILEGLGLEILSAENNPNGNLIIKARK